MSFIPREDLITALADLGMSRNAATRGLYYTGNHSADMAAAFVFENQEKMDLEAPITDLPALDVEGGSSDDDEVDEEGMAAFMGQGDFYKMVFVVNMDLSMGVGKVAAQVAHAALGLYKIISEDPHKHGQALMSWDQFGETKIVLKGLNAVQLTELAMKAESKRLPHYMVEDAGRTQVAAGSMTVLSIMGKNSLVDEVTGGLSLL